MATTAATNNYVNKLAEIKSKRSLPTETAAMMEKPRNIVHRFQDDQCRTEWANIVAALLRILFFAFQCRYFSVFFVCWLQQLVMFLCVVGLQYAAAAATVQTFNAFTVK